MYRWQKLLVQQERNGKCLILPAALNSVQGQENTLKPSPFTRLDVSSWLQEVQQMSFKLPCWESSLSCNLFQCLLARDPLF